MKSLFIGIDFDGTMVEHKYPLMGKPIEDALETVHQLQEAGHKIILYTMRDKARLQEAVEYLEGEGVVLYGVNENKTQHHWTSSPKVHCNIVIDDVSLGVPLIYPETGKPYVDWLEVELLLITRGIL